MKLKKLLFTAMLCGMGYSAYPQEPVVPNPLDNLKPWVDDTTSALTKVSVYSEWTELVENTSDLLGFDYETLQPTEKYIITRNPDSNRVSLSIESEYSKEERIWTFPEDRSMGWKNYVQKRYYADDYDTTYVNRTERTYDTEGNIIKELLFEGSDTIKIFENGK